ncbi:MAG: hypothetical protein QOI67_1151 [Gaiellaceae bacterium]|nr:hypothetical protein [Gaiellaceae bacterium]
MIRARSVALVAAPAVVALGSGFLIGYPAQVAAATTIAFAAVVSLISTRDLAARAELRPRPVRGAADSPPLEQLRQVGRALTAAQASEVGVDRDLRPLFRPIAAMRLARRGLDLDRHSGEARAILGEQLWELVRADRARGSNRAAGGISTVGLQSMIERLERI